MPGTFRELIREYVAERRVAAKSKKGASAGYLQFLQQGLEPLAEWGDTTGVVPADFDRPQFTRYLDSLKRRDGFQQKSSAGKDLAPSTWHAYARLARAVMIYAADMGYITKAPKLDIVRPKPDPKLLSEDQLKQALAACRGRKGARDEAILCLMADSGIRRAELCSLVWGDLEYSKGRGYVHVRHGKGDKDRKSYFLEPTWTLLQASGKDRPHGPDDPVFLALDDEGPMKPASLGALLTDIGTRAGFRLRPHMLRHTAARRMLKRGMSPSAVKRALGHSSITITVDLYGSFDDEMTEDDYFEHMNGD